MANIYYTRGVGSYPKLRGKSVSISVCTKSIKRQKVNVHINWVLILGETHSPPPPPPPTHTHFFMGGGMPPAPRVLRHCIRKTSPVYNILIYWCRLFGGRSGFSVAVLSILTVLYTGRVRGMHLWLCRTLR